MEEVKKTSDDFLSWEITRTEKRDRVRQLLLAIGATFILVSVIGALLYRPFSFARTYSTGRLDDFFYTAIMVVISTIGAVYILFLMNKFLPYVERKYYLDNNGVTVWKGGRKKQFTWNELESFSVHQSMYFIESTRDWPGEHMRKEMYLTSERIEGKVFYLFKRSKNKFLGFFYKTFVVLYSEPEISQKVLDFLLRYLPQRDMKPTVDLGLRFYYFK